MVFGGCDCFNNWICVHLRRKSMEEIKCFMCQEKITDSNRSDEHIILRSFGGRLSSKSLLCKKCNSDFGNGVDGVLYKQIPLPTLLGIELQKGEAEDVLLSKKDGAKFFVSKKLKPTQQHPTVIKTDKGIKYYARTEKEARKKIREFYPDKNVEDVLKNLKWIDTHIEEPLFHEYDLIQQDAYFSICKTAVSYFLHCGGDISQVEYARYFLSGKASVNNIVKYYYRDSLDAHLSKDEISHTIYLRADPESNLCYCYLELFSVHCFLIVLNRNYVGKKIEKVYSYDLINCNEIEKDLSINLSREEINSLKFPGDEQTEKGYFGRLKRVYDIKGIKMEVRKRKQKLVKEVQ